jgi:hypothetical protein
VPRIRGTVGFNRRTLRRLERRGPLPCPECGLSPDEPGRIVVIDDGTPAEGFPDDPEERCPEERCERCGRSLWCVIHIVYDDAEGGGVEL